MIKTFRDVETQKIYQRERSRKLLSDIQQVALRKLRMVNHAININDLRVPPANCLEKLSKDREGQYVFESMINGASVLNGKVEMRLMLRSRIIIRRSRNG